MDRIKQLIAAIEQLLINTRTWLLNFVKEDNGLDADVLKILSLLAVVNISAYAWYGLIVRDHFVVLDYGKALAIVLAAAGSAIGIKNWTTK